MAEIVYDGGRRHTKAEAARAHYDAIIAGTALLENERNQVEIRRRRLDATVLLVKALGGGWSTAALLLHAGSGYG